VHREIKRKHVTLAIVWEEYIAGTPDGPPHAPGALRRLPARAKCGKAPPASGLMASPSVS
jgi:hypothetical protein